MKNRSNYLYLMATLLLAGCSADEALDEGGRTPISFGNTVVQTVETRAATNLNEGFLSVDDAVTVKISKTGVGSYTDYTYVASNDEGQMTLSGSTTPYYPGDGSNVDIRAYYPSTAGGSFTVSNDQTTDANYKASDLMFASVSDQARSTSAINLAFAHQMAKIIVNTTAAEGSGITITGVRLKNIKPTVTFTPAATDVANVVGAASGEAVDITMTNNGAALIPAQAVDGNFLVITTSAGDATYSLTKTFAAGHQYIINLTVSSAEVGTTTAITGWSDGGTGSFPANTMQILTFNVNGAIFNMMPVEGGTYSMTYSTSASSSNDVTVTGTLSNYYIGQTEVTNALYQAVMTTLPTLAKAGETYPVQCVTWNDINAELTGFLAILNQKLASQLSAYGMPTAKFKLPSEAQWQYAAIGGKNTHGYTYSGSNYLETVAWWGVDYNLNAKNYTNPSGISVSGNSNGTIHTVGTKAANELGLYDMTGNVWEWCRDSYAAIAAGDLGKDYVNTTETTEHVIRGGSWGNINGQYQYQRVSYRGGKNHDYYTDDIGFRLALVLQ